MPMVVIWGQVLKGRARMQATLVCQSVMNAALPIELPWLMSLKVPEHHPCDTWSLAVNKASLVVVVIKPDNMEIGQLVASITALRISDS